MTETHQTWEIPLTYLTNRHQGFFKTPNWVNCFRQFLENFAENQTRSLT